MRWLWGIYELLLKHENGKKVRVVEEYITVSQANEHNSRIVSAL